MSDHISKETLQLLCNTVQQRLKTQSADYRMLLALEDAMRRVEEGVAAAPIGEAHSAEGSALELAIRVTQAGAAKRVLQTRGEPVPIDELLQLMPVFGGRTTTRASLSSSLSQSPEFVSVRHKSRWCWWLAAEPRDRKSKPQDQTASRSLRWRIGRRRG
ncbi:hypothetical protein ABEG18_06275 [Alsobacter sp. KACC 23698]|uniref:Uncharacterized protein n=1 Tax=Alsobacter sp. KACC 23698 TaxID=3149229 RepID=A0AAU7JJY0_9HYPH